MLFENSAANRARRGTVNYLSGAAAEDSVARHYARSGAEVIARRWRGKAGEVDLILRLGDLHVFVEVKKAATFDLAAERLTSAQLSRIMSAAEEFLAAGTGQSPGFIRIDAALVDGEGKVEVIENVTLT